MSKVEGGCHCGALRFTAEGDFSSGMECNCSHCEAKGFVLAFVPRDKFTLTRGDGAYTTYHFNRAMIDHTFCKTCGTEAFAFGKSPGGGEMAMINLRCVDGLDRAALTIHHANGKDF